MHTAKGGASRFNIEVMNSGGSLSTLQIQCSRNIRKIGIKAGSKGRPVSRASARRRKEARDRPRVDTWASESTAWEFEINSEVKTGIKLRNSSIIK